LANLCLTDDPYDAIKDADIVVECLGGNGVELTRELVLKTIKSHQAVIMSSKKCLAFYGPEIMRTVKQYHGIFHYDATVGGGIPISSVFETMGRCETIEKIYGICNGTSNYILDKMEQKGISYEHALNKAIKKGYAENNPSEDVEGYDSLYKAVIMMGFGMNYWIDSKTIIPRTITSLTPRDFVVAEKTHNVIKPVFILEKTVDSVTCDIGPMLLPKDSLLATVKENNNIIVIYGSESRERAFYGQGAGQKPTASAMFDDLNKTIKEILFTNLSFDKLTMFEPYS
jgi:homoserine dehydrogenase